MSKERNRKLSYLESRRAESAPRCSNEKIAAAAISLFEKAGGNSDGGKTKSLSISAVLGATKRSETAEWTPQRLSFDPCRALCS